MSRMQAANQRLRHEFGAIRSGQMEFCNLSMAALSHGATESVAVDHWADYCRICRIQDQNYCKCGISAAFTAPAGDPGGEWSFVGYIHRDDVGSANASLDSGSVEQLVPLR